MSTRDGDLVDLQSANTRWTEDLRVPLELGVLVKIKPRISRLDHHAGKKSIFGSKIYGHREKVRKN